MEERKDIPWYEWLYQVSNLWNVISINYNKTWQIKQLKKNTRWWYNFVLLCNWNTQINYYIHRLVLLSFTEQTDVWVNHKNWIRNDNRLENLEWSNNSHNQKHSYSVLWNKPNRANLWLIWKLSPLSKRVAQITKWWDIVKERESMSDVYRELWYSTWNISSCCRWIKKSVWWYLRRFI